MPRASALGTLVLCFFAVGRLAAEPSAEDKALATALFREGRELMALGRVPEACRKLEESQRLDPGGGTLLNLGLCHEREGLLVRAWSEFNEALAVARRDGRADREAAATEHATALEPRLSRLTISVAPGARVDGLRVERDGSELGEASWNTAMPVDGGEHVVKASAPGRVDFTASVVLLGEADSKNVEVPELAPLASPPAAAPVARATPVTTPGVSAAPSAKRPGAERRADPTVSATSGRATLGWALGGAGVAALGVAGYFGVRAFDEQAASDDACPHDRCSARGAELGERAGTFADASTVLTLAGVASLGAGVYLLLTPASPPAPGALANPTLRVSARSSTLALDGRF